MCVCVSVSMCVSVQGHVHPRVHLHSREVLRSPVCPCVFWGTFSFFFFFLLPVLSPLLVNVE